MNTHRTRRMLGPTLALCLLLGSIVPSGLSDAGYACYQQDCDWDRTAEEHLQETAQHEGGAIVEVGSSLAASVQELQDNGYLSVRENVTAHGQTWSLLVEVDYQCSAIVTIRNLSVPGYESLTAALDSSVPALLATENLTEIEVCGRLYAGFPVDSNQTSSGGQLRFQTGTDAELQTGLGAGNASFPFWTGYVLTNTLSVQRGPGSEVLITVSLGLHALFEGDLGWGTGSVRLDLLDVPWRRAFVVRSLDACFEDKGTTEALRGTVGTGTCIEAGSTSATAGASRGALAVHETAQDHFGAWADVNRYLPTHICLSISGGNGAFCNEVVSQPVAVYALATGRLQDAYHTSIRINYTEHTAAEFVDDCLDLSLGHCGASGAELFVTGAPVPETVNTVTQLDYLSQSVGGLFLDLRMDEFQADFAAWLGGFSSDSGGEQG